MKKLLRTLGRQLGPIIPPSFLINNGIRDEFCGSGTKVKSREIIDLDEPYYDRQILGSSRNESSSSPDHAIRTAFNKGRGEESSSGGTAIPIPLRLNQSSMDDFSTLPPQNLVIARDLPIGLPHDKPQPTFFTTDAGSTSESPQQSPANPSPTTSFQFSGLLNSQVLSPSPSSSSVGVNGVQITDFNGLDVSLTCSRKLRS